MDKKYIEEQYHLAMLDFFTAKNEDEQWEARKTMARLEQIAMQEYGFNYADELNQKFTNPEKGDVDMVNKYLNKVLEELENDPEVKDLRMPDEWDAHFRKIIEETVERSRSEE